MTEVSQIRNSCSTKNHGLQLRAPTTEVESCTTRDTIVEVFVNQGETAWNETRNQWVGDKRHGRRLEFRKIQSICWSTTYEELLQTGNVFDKAIPLSISCFQEMVDFLVDIWQGEGLHD